MSDDTHADITEAAFLPLVGNNLAARCGPAAVYREPQGTHQYALPSGDIPDFVVEGSLGLFAVEVENDLHSLKEAVGQARMYAREYKRALSRHAFPVVVVPPPTDPALLADARDEVRVIVVAPPTDH